MAIVDDLEQEALAASYFRQFEGRMPPKFTAMGQWQETFWHLLAGLSVGLGVWYLHWRWTSSLNTEALWFSIIVALAETLTFIGTLLFFFDIWKEGDTPQASPPVTRSEAALVGDGPIRIDVFLTTFDESVGLLSASLEAIATLQPPENTHIVAHILDDGNRPEVAKLAQTSGVNYISRDDNQGFKAGNLRNALFQTSGDFVLILDADTRVLPGFLKNTLGYFRDPNVAWVQTPHWFYDLPGFEGRGRIKDPFMTNPKIFFDVIQRRRNRHNASFCCGAGSIHRREAIFYDALRQLGQVIKQHEKAVPEGGSGQTAVRTAPLQPFRFHVSEDIFTSIKLHSDPRAKWKSVYHPQAESRMLSPWSVAAWTAQRLKYAGGTFDIMLNANPIWKKGMPLATKLHYAATFWSYLSIIWLSVLMVAPIFSLLTGIAPVDAYSLQFFLHLLPLLLVNEIAMMVGCKGYNANAGRLMAIGCLPFQWKALWMVMQGRKPKFPPTPKVPGLAGAAKRLIPSIVVLAVMALAILWGLTATMLGLPGFSPSQTAVNIFWCSWNALAVWMVVRLSWWCPEKELKAMKAAQMKGSHEHAV